ncbi:site-2 protease family protein [candidate division KSB1 bacterium]|nr:site-2 protease family protein [candidate division KSB1 bacterium]
MNRESLYDWQYAMQKPEPPRRAWKQKLGSIFRLPLTNLVLFMLTLVTAYLAYGIWYSLAATTILLAHEMGHFLTCRRYGVQATLPYFIPMFNPFGTMGAVIKIGSRIPNRKALFDIGAAGPLAGMVLALPAIIIGIKLSTIVDTASSGGLPLGESLLFHHLSQWLRPELTPETDLMLHPLAFAGWFGMFVTALNLLPIGQLDGGHVVYSIFGKKSTAIYRLAIFAFALNTIVYPMWILFFEILIVFGRKHPPPIDDITPIDLKRKILGAFIFVVFVVSFIPFPFDYL